MGVLTNMTQVVRVLTNTTLIPAAAVQARIRPEFLYLANKMFFEERGPGLLLKYADDSRAEHLFKYYIFKTRLEVTQQTARDHIPASPCVVLHTHSSFDIQISLPTRQKINHPQVEVRVKQSQM